MLFKKKEPVYETRLERYWDNNEAAFRYRLVKYEIVKGKLDEGFYWLGGGDKDWANKIAKHYGISITTPVKGD